MPKDRKRRQSHIDGTRARWYAQGLCGQCGRTPEPGKKLCNYCQEIRRRKIAAKRDTGECQDCSNPSIPGRRLCEKCFGKSVRRRIAKRAELAIKGLCFHCGTKPTEGGTVCSECKEKGRLRTAAHRQKRLDAGLCLRCGKYQPIPDKQYCTDCFFKDMAGDHFGARSAWTLLKQLFDNADGICPYSGVRLTPGVDASLDHIIPLSKGGTTDISNVQWVHVMVNQMKRDYSHAEFLLMVQTIARHHGLA